MTRSLSLCLIALQAAIGWHFLYEGVWKIDSRRGGIAHRASRVVVYEAVQRGPNWADEIAKTFKGRGQGLPEDKKQRLLLMPAEPRPDWLWLHDDELELGKPAEGEGPFTSEGFLRQAPGPLQRLIPDRDGLERLTPAQAAARLEARAQEAAAHYGFDAAQTARLRQVRDRLLAYQRAAFAHPDVARRIADYRAFLPRLDRPVRTAFDRERLAADRKAADTILSETLAIIDDPLIELAWQAEQIATVAQMTRGPLPPPPGATDTLDRLVMTALTGIGIALLLGLAPRWAALAAAGLLATFFLAALPLPGSPAASMGGHYLYIDRNLIELIAALALAASNGGYRLLDSWKEIRHAAERQRETVGAR